MSGDKVPCHNRQSLDDDWDEIDFRDTTVHNNGATQRTGRRQPSAANEQHNVDNRGPTDTPDDALQGAGGGASRGEL